MEAAVREALLCRGVTSCSPLSLFPQPLQLKSDFHQEAAQDTRSGSLSSIDGKLGRVRRTKGVKGDEQSRLNVIELEVNELLQVSPKPSEKSGGDLDKTGAELKGNHIFERTS